MVFVLFETTHATSDKTRLLALHEIVIGSLIRQKNYSSLLANVFYPILSLSSWTHFINGMRTFTKWTDVDTQHYILALGRVTLLKM